MTKIEDFGIGSWVEFQNSYFGSIFKCSFIGALLLTTLLDSSIFSLLLNPGRLHHLLHHRRLKNPSRSTRSSLQVHCWCHRASPPSSATKIWINSSSAFLQQARSTSTPTSLVADLCFQSPFQVSPPVFSDLCWFSCLDCSCSEIFTAEFVICDIYNTCFSLLLFLVKRRMHCFFS